MSIEDFTQKKVDDDYLWVRKKFHFDIRVREAIWIHRNQIFRFVDGKMKIGPIKFGFKPKTPPFFLVVESTRSGKDIHTSLVAIYSTSSAFNSLSDKTIQHGTTVIAECRMTVCCRSEVVRFHLHFVPVVNARTIETDVLITSFMNNQIAFLAAKGLWSENTPDKVFS